MVKRRNDLLTPTQILVLGFVFLILLGTLFLMLPLSSLQGTWTSFIDALFTATSAVTTTGLVVVDTGSYYSLFGQIVILILFQIGGLGYMIFIALIISGIGGNLSLRSSAILHESIKQPTEIEVKKYVTMIILFTLCFEVIGAILLSLYWSQDFPAMQAIYYGIFHSISAFCTAGFALWGDGLSSWNNSVYFNILILTISIAGGMGFLVLYDLIPYIKKLLGNKYPRYLMLHTKLALILTVILFTFGSLLIFFSERWPGIMNLQEKILASLFQAISASTSTGFNTIDIGSMTISSLLIIIVLMIIGASPGGTGGGIKTTTVGVIISFIWAFLNGREEVVIYNRSIPSKLINQAFALGFMAILWLISVSIILTEIEKMNFIKILFEVASALGTVGLSTGITSSFSLIGKILLCITMLAGRVGLLALGFSLIGKQESSVIKYPKEEILIG